MITSFLSRLGTKIIVGAALLAALFVLVTCEMKRHSDIRERRAEIDAALSDASERSRKQASDVSIGAIERQRERERETATNREKINEAGNAKDSAGDAGNAGFSVLCERPSYRNTAACLQRANTAANPR